MSLAITTITDSISKLSVSGLVIKDIDEIPVGVDARQPTLIPLPDFVTNFVMIRDSFGGGTTAKMTVSYTLGYRLLYKPVGAGRELEYYDNLVSMAGLIMDAILAIDTLTGLVDIEPEANGIINMGVVNDPAGNAFLGCDIRMRVKEFVN
jgi:hypothetical protein